MGFLIGILSGITTALGVGGGTILILFLTIFLRLDQKTSQAINLFCYIPAAIICIFLNIKNKNIIFKNIHLIVLFGIIGSIIGSFVSKNIDSQILKKLFGIFLIMLAISEIFYLFKQKKDKN